MRRFEDPASKRAAIILAGGLSERFGRYKGLVSLSGKPLILHVLARIQGIIDEIVVVVSSKNQKDVLEPIMTVDARIVVDNREGQSPLIGALAGFESSRSEYSLLLPCDTPFIEGEIASLLLNLCVGRSAVVPRWPNGYLEPLQAAYRTKQALMAVKLALEHKKRDLRSMLNYMQGVRHVSTKILRRIDSELLTFFNINTLEDLRRAEELAK